MNDVLGIVAWAALGLVASHASSIFPFRRGVLGVALIWAVGIVGGIVGGAVGLFLGVYDRTTHPLGLAFAAVTAALATYIAHALTSRRTATGASPGARPAHPTDTAEASSDVDAAGHQPR
jgi:uncharacterized membrane protein YeaQ/YmgE (transglycosylase-associated protein family)